MLAGSRGRCWSWAAGGGFSQPESECGKAAPRRSLVRFRLERGAPTLCDPFVLARLIAYPSPSLRVPWGWSCDPQGPVTVPGHPREFVGDFIQLPPCRGSPGKQTSSVPRRGPKHSEMGAGHWEGSESHFGGFLERDPGSEGEGLLLVAAIQTGAAGRVGIASAMHPAGRFLVSGFLWLPNPQESRESPAEFSGRCVEGEM